jgi:hypothetical protein
MNPLFLTGVLATFEFTIEHIVNLFNPKKLNILSEEPNILEPELTSEVNFTFYNLVKIRAGEI